MTAVRAVLDSNDMFELKFEYLGTAAGYTRRGRARLEGNSLSHGHLYMSMRRWPLHLNSYSKAQLLPCRRRRLP